MENAELLLHWKRNVLINIYGSITMKAKEVNFDLKVELNKRNRKFKVTQSILTKMDDFNLEFSGFGLFNPIAREIIHLLFKIWRKDVTNVIETLVKEDIEDRLEKLQIY